MKSRKKNDRMAHYEAVKELENLSPISSNEKKCIQIVMKGKSDWPISPKGKDPAENETADKKTDKSSSSSEYPTPNFEFPGAVPIFSKPDQIFEQNSHPCDSPHEIYSVITQNINQNFQVNHNQTAFDVDFLNGIWSQYEISQPNKVPSIVLSASSQSNSIIEIPTQQNLDINNRHADFYTNFLKGTSDRKAKTQPLSSNPTLTYSRNNSNEQQNIPIFDINDIDDFSQLPTPNIVHFKLAMLAKSQSLNVQSLNDFRNDYRRTSEMISEEDLQNHTTKVETKDTEHFLIRNGLRRKRNMNRRVINSKEDKENAPVMINFQQVNHCPKKLVSNIFSKNVLEPLRFDDTLTPILQERHLNLNDSSDKSGDAFSPDSASPEKKKIRLELEVSPDFVTEDCGSTPYPRGRKKTVRFVDLTQQDNTNVDDNFNYEENAKNTDEESSMELINEPEERLSSILDVVDDDRRQNAPVKYVLDVKATAKTSLIVAITDGKENAMSTDEESSVELINKPGEELSSPLDVFDDYRRQNAPLKDVLDVKATAETSLGVAIADGKENASQKCLVVEKSSAFVINDTNGKRPSKSSVVFPPDVDEMLTDSATTDFTQSNSFVSTLLSDHCSEYDQSLQNENSPDIKLAANTIDVSNFIASFYVDTDVIHRQIDNTLQFLESDMAGNYY